MFIAYEHRGNTGELPSALLKVPLPEYVKVQVHIWVAKLKPHRAKGGYALSYPEQEGMARSLVLDLQIR